MRNPWETGETYCGHRQAWQSTDDRISVAKRMPVERLRACLEYPGTQKTVRQFIERRLRKPLSQHDRLPQTRLDEMICRQNNY